MNGARPRSEGAGLGRAEVRVPSKGSPEAVKHTGTRGGGAGVLAAQPPSPAWVSAPEAEAQGSAPRSPSPATRLLFPDLPCPQCPWCHQHLCLTEPGVGFSPPAPPLPPRGRLLAVVPFFVGRLKQVGEPRVAVPAGTTARCARLAVRPTCVRCTAPGPVSLSSRSRLRWGPQLGLPPFHSVTLGRDPGEGAGR